MPRDEIRVTPLVVALALAIATAASFAARAVAGAQVEPVEHRVTALEADQKRQDAQIADLKSTLNEVRGDVKELIRRTPPHP